MQVLVVGAGLSGAVIARELAEAGHMVTVVESRDHLAGNCHTERDPETGVMVHRYGPHIFHTDDVEVWNWVNRFARFRHYVHRVKVTARGRIYSLPVNLHTINQFFGKTMRPDEAAQFMARQGKDGAASRLRSFEDQALCSVGRDIYETFFQGYTCKQWGRHPSRLPASVFRRLPLRFSYDDNYFNHRFQGIPEEGYTEMVARILDHPHVTVMLRTRFSKKHAGGYDHVFYSGPLDGYFSCRLGPLAYRTLNFEVSIHKGDYQGCAVMNFADGDVAWTRVTEHKHLAPWESHESTICYREFSREAGPDDIPFYPIRLVREKALLKKYQTLAAREGHVTFIGRLGTYRYLDMDVAIREAIDAARRFIRRHERVRPLWNLPETGLSGRDNRGGPVREEEAVS